MTRIFATLTALLVLSAGCARLPEILPPPLSFDGEADPFASVYPSGRWQLYHTIDADVPGGGIRHLAGGSVISSDAKSIERALMTLEGLVLFSGRDAGALTVERAVSPFDRSGFAHGLMADLRMLFFQPEARVLETGVLPDGSRVKRFQSDGGDTTDLLVREDGTWSIHRYAGTKLECAIEARDVRAGEITDGAVFAQTLTLNRPGLLGYTLEMRLVEALRLE